MDANVGMRGNLSTKLIRRYPWRRFAAFMRRLFA
jgi:hypothetical protein